MRATRTLLPAAALIVLAATPAAAQEDDGGWIIDSFDVAIDIRPDGTLAVSEEIRLDFGGLQRRGIFRMIPTHYELSPDDTQVDLPPDRTTADFDRVIAVEDVTVTSTAPDDIELSDLGHALQVRIGDEDVEVSGEQAYTISYTVTGTLNSFAGADELYWDATGDDWPVPIARATTVVTAPEIADAACFHGSPGATALCDSLETTAEELIAGAVMLQPGQGMTVAVSLPPDAVDVAPPLLEERYNFGRALTGSPLAWPLAALTALLGFGAVGLLGYRQGRDRVARGGVTVDGRIEDPGSHRPLFSRPEVPVRYRPPDDLHPAQLGLIVDERVEGVEVSATIVDLAVRGHVRIEEADGGKDWLLHEVRGTDRDDLLPYEWTLLTGLFAEGESVRLSELKGTFAEQYAKVRDQIYTDGVKRGWFPRKPTSTRSAWLLLGIGALVVAGVLAYFLLRFTEVGIVAVPLVLAALALIVAHRWMPHRTPRAAASWARRSGSPSSSGPPTPSGWPSPRRSASSSATCPTRSSSAPWSAGQRRSPGSAPPAPRGRRRSAAGTWGTVRSRTSVRWPAACRASPIRSAPQ